MKYSDSGLSYSEKENRQNTYRRKHRNNRRRFDDFRIKPIVKTERAPDFSRVTNLRTAIDVTEEDEHEVSTAEQPGFAFYGTRIESSGEQSDQN